MIRIEIPLPPRELHPNARTHWAEKARRTGQYRLRAWASAYAHLHATKMFPPKWRAAQVRITFHFADNRRRDADNLLAWMKAGLDGIADAGVVENDAGFTFPPVEVSVDKANPRVVLEVTPL